MTPFPGSVVSQPVYHGTNNRFTAFKLMPTNRFGLGIKLQQSEKANALFFFEKLEDGHLAGRIVYECYINIANPVVGKEGVNPHAKQIIQQVLLRKQVGDEEGRKYVLIGKDFYYYLGNDGDDVGAYLFRGKQWGVDWIIFDDAEIVDALKSGGFDGSVVYETEQNITGLSYCVFSPRQVKIVREVESRQRNDD